MYGVTLMNGLICIYYTTGLASTVACALGQSILYIGFCLSFLWNICFAQTHVNELSLFFWFHLFIHWFENVQIYCNICFQRVPTLLNVILQDMSLCLWQDYTVVFNLHVRRAIFFLLICKHRFYPLLYIACVDCSISIPSAMLFIFADIISILSFVEVTGSGSLSFLPWIHLHICLIECSSSANFSGGSSAHWDVRNDNSCYNVLVWFESTGFLQFWLVFQLVQSEYTTDEPVNCIFAAPKAD